MKKKYRKLNKLLNEVQKEINLINKDMKEIELTFGFRQNYEDCLAYWTLQFFSEEGEIGSLTGEIV